MNLDRKIYIVLFFSVVINAALLAQHYYISKLNFILENKPKIKLVQSESSKADAQDKKDSISLKEVKHLEGIYGGSDSSKMEIRFGIVNAGNI
ncbi:MAG TPA: hypothetical protein VFM18_24515, partial [Methanosarcina sp.]|nr:hypothetical protein [Methanosarcina sp.]